MPVHPWSKREQFKSCSLKVGGRHLARFLVALEFVAELLAFDDFAHSGAFDGRDMDEGVSAAVVRLDETEALRGIEPFNCASGNDEPFQAIENPNANALRRIAIFEEGFVQSAVLIAR